MLPRLWVNLLLFVWTQWKSDIRTSTYFGHLIIVPIIASGFWMLSKIWKSICPNSGFYVIFQHPYSIEIRNVSGSWTSSESRFQTTKSVQNLDSNMSEFRRNPGFQRLDFWQSLYNTIFGITKVYWYSIFLAHPSSQT